MKNLIQIILFVSPLLTFAQKSTKYEWEKNRGLTTLTPEEQKYSEHILKMYREYEYAWENDELVTYQTDHRITRVTTTNAIDRHNRIYISMWNVKDIVTLKARSINSAGRVTNFDEKNLKEIKDEESDNTYRIFAIEGIEVNSEIEFFYTLRTKGRTTESYYLQQETPIRDVTVQVRCPKKLAFDFRVYNDDTKVSTDTLAGKNRYTYHRTGISSLTPEGFSFYDSNRKRIDFKLAYNFNSSTARLNTWADAGRVFYNRLTESNDDSEKELGKFLKTIKDDPKLAPVARIKNIEDNIKNSFRVITNSSDPSLGEVSQILKSHQASGSGIAQLLFMTYERLKIPVQLVITCNREKYKFDGTFDSWGFLDEYLLYFPETNGFMVPDNFELRYPLIPKNLSGHKGLFIEPVAVGNLKTGITWVREIPALPYTADLDNLDIELRFSDDLESNQISHRRSFTGYDASGMIPYYETMSEDQKKKFVEELFRQSVPDLQLEKWTVTPMMDNTLSRIDIAVNYTTNYFLEKAGNRILLKVGDLIGPQSELYSDEKRQTPIENTNNRGYERTIRIYLPKGYQVGNLEGLTMREEYKDGKNIPFSFVSSYSQQGDVLTVKVNEYYKELYAPLDRYEDFRKVINAAADFNKVTVVLTKK